jgi:WD40 repeat protein
MMCLDRDDLYERAEWDGAAGTSRRVLLEHLQSEYPSTALTQAFISPKLMVPSRRLATLLDQARRLQQSACMYHEDHDPTTLYVDHLCTGGSTPKVTTHILADHTDEVLGIEWSPDGMMLASAGADKTVIIWQLEVSGNGIG